MKAMTSQDKKNRSITSNGFDSNSEFANALNDFYFRFNDEHDITNVHSGLIDMLSDCTATSQPTVSAHSVPCSINVILERALGLT